MDNEDVFANLHEVKNVDEEEKSLFKTISKKIISYIESVKGIGDKVIVTIDEDADEEYELIKKKKKRKSSSTKKKPEIKWYDSYRRYCKRGATLINEGHQHINSLSQRRKSTLLKDTEALTNNLQNFISKIKNVP
jgi:hypothetical protein